ncbi:putative disease resistance protein RGA4 [Dendrobium catenatum]|uniref:putative disease resistance protein RGA4 n=1 Tax=Dendrobium catenatum TaxID=906689 RepID=UPI00109F7B9B|nr:putative disease resistance protein RGA4 [Dendrobium catenatum]
MAEWFGAPIIEKLINTGFQYLGDQVRWQTGMKEELERLRENHPKIQAVVNFASSQEQIRDRNPALNEWLWQLRDAIDEADDVLDDLEYMKLEKQLTKDKKQRKVRSIMKSINKRLVKIAKRALKIDPNLKKLKAVVQKLDRVSTTVDTFLYLVRELKQEHQEQQLERETGSLPTNDLIGRDEQKDFVMQWLRKLSNEEHQALVNGTDLYRNISLLSIKMWVCVSNNFDVKKVIADMLESLKNERIHLETLDTLQNNLRTEIMSKKFLLILDDIWEEEKQDISKWEKVLAPLAYGKIGSRILVTTRMDSVAMMIAKVIKKNTKIFRLEGLQEYQCLQLLNSHAFADVENPNDYQRLRSIAGEIVKKLSGSPLAAKVIGGVLNSSLDERHWTKDLCNALIEIFKVSRSLRLLYICSLEDLKIIPEEIGNLIHLRYLKIDCYDLTMLPRSLSNLYHLQYLIHYGHTVGDDFLLSDISNLLNLRYMGLPVNYISLICGIGKLKSLQEMYMFDLRDTSGYRIGELENMNDLCKLGINCLENVKDAEEASSAKLSAKWRLTDLTLCWSNTDSRNIDLDENVLNNLQPPKCLRNLSIKRYMGARSAIWMNNVNLLSNIEKIEKIEFTDCLECETLPPFGQLPFLKSLTLSNMPKVKWLESKFNGNDKCHAFPTLEVLHISYLKALEDWFEAGVPAEDGCLFPCLIELELFDCPKLKELPSLPSVLKSLRIESTGWTTLNFCSNSNPIPLETLEVFHCPNITSLPLADEIARLAALRYLEIRYCPNLISLGRYRQVETTNNCHLMLSVLEISDPSVLLMEPLRSIASLKKLIIENNDELVSFTNEAEQWFLKVRSSLSELRFSDLKSLQSLPSSLESLFSLKKLYIGYDVPMLRELPNLPSSLEYLYIWGCHPELKELYREDGGFDRHKIAHIPHIQFVY